MMCGVGWLETATREESGAEVWREDFAEAFEAGVNEDSDVGGGEAGDFLDFCVAEALLELENDDVALVL